MKHFVNYKLFKISPRILTENERLYTKIVYYGKWIKFFLIIITSQKLYKSNTTHKEEGILYAYVRRQQKYPKHLILMRQRDEPDAYRKNLT